MNNLDVFSHQHKNFRPEPEPYKNDAAPQHHLLFHFVISTIYKMLAFLKTKQKQNNFPFFQMKMKQLRLLIFEFCVSKLTF
jgi:hypothetical protein